MLSSKIYNFAADSTHSSLKNILKSPYNLYDCCMMILIIRMQYNMRNFWMRILKNGIPSIPNDYKKLCRERNCQTIQRNWKKFWWKVYWGMHLKIMWKTTVKFKQLSLQWKNYENFKCQNPLYYIAKWSTH